MKKLAVTTLMTLSLAMGNTYAKGPDNRLDNPNSKGQEASIDAQIKNYWTPDRLKDAKPLEVPTRAYDDYTLSNSLKAPGPIIDPNTGEPAAPGYAPGWAPGQGQQPGPEEVKILKPSDPLYALATGVVSPQHGSAPSNPLSGPYGPFQRWTEFESITAYPKSTHGKLFFSFGSSNYVCSATVINRSTLITAGHCNHDGNSTWATNRLFCPSYRNGVNSSLGCWSVISSKTSAGWVNNGDPDYDYACLITSTSGTVINNSIGNVTGWLGRAWNWSASQAERTFGYPAASPFNGNRLITTASTEWYSYDFTSGGQVSKLIGSDLTGGSSGGSWILGWNNNSLEFADSDGNSATDPGSNWVNGVNSHKRCRTTCQSPPTSTNGVYWQEMSSPPFRNTSSSDESEDIIAVCLNAGGTS